MAGNRVTRCGFCSATVRDGEIETLSGKGCRIAFGLLRLDTRGECVADSWHETFEAAKAHASFELGIEDGDWKDTEPQH